MIDSTPDCVPFECLVTPEDAALQLMVSEKTLANWRSNGEGPEYIKTPARRIYYRQQVLIEWWEQRQRCNAA